MTRELGPVIASLMVAGRVGAAMAAEIGTMRVTEQIDALTTLSTDPLRYLVLPRLVAGLVALPFLVLIADIIGVFGGFLVGTYKLHFNPSSYLSQTGEHLETMDVVSGLIKASVFGFVVTLMGCYHGYQSRDGAAGESLVIIGGSGTGKSVLIKCILGLLRPEAGSIRIDGVETVGMSRAQREPLMRKFGMLFQGGALFDSLTVWQNVAFGLIQGRGIDRD